jgi:glucose/arabinose dehydrogenase
MKIRLVGRAATLVLALTAIGGLLDAAQSAASAPATGAAATGGLRLDRIGVFQAPMYVDNAPGFKRLLFVVERQGTIAVLRGRHKLGHRFLDIHSRVSTVGEGGLYSVAFPPNYRRSRRFYVAYANRQGKLEIDEFKRRGRSSTRARASSRRRVLVISHPGEHNHYGGQLQFGPDGYLYISTGDGGGSDDNHDNARRLSKLLGKLLRIDPRRHGQDRYRSPAGNPYLGGPGRDEIYAYGLRNPWRFSFDQATGDIAIGDVGQGAVEEVDYETPANTKGANFGWPEYEGNQVHDASRPGPDPPHPPIFTYSHSTCSPCAITGGYVVRDPDLSSLAGRYLYADFYGGQIHSLIGGPTDDTDTGLDVPQLSSFGEGVGGRIYVSSLTGPVYRLMQGS